MASGLNGAKTGEKASGYLELLRRNREFRQLWFGQIVSQTGDWFDTIALFQLALHLTGSGKAVALILTVRFLATVVASPLAGVVADRFDRRKIMIAADLSRAVVVLGFLFVRRAEDVWIIYVLTVVQFVASAFFEPARAAAVPSVVEPKDLVTANAIASATWSAMLTLGAALGGAITAAFGAQAAFLVDSATFFASAWLIYNLRLPHRAIKNRLKLTLARATGIADFGEGFAYLLRRPTVFLIVLAKPAWSVTGGMLALLPVFGERVFPVAGSGALGVSVLYVVRGVGTALGPILFRRFAGQTAIAMQTAIGLAFFVGGVFYALFGATNVYAPAILFLFLAYVGGSLIWLNATVLLQFAVADDFRGRVFATETALVTLVLAASSFASGELLDRYDYSPQSVVVGLGFLAAAPGFVWFALRRFWRENDELNA